MALPGQDPGLSSGQISSINQASVAAVGNAGKPSIVFGIFQDVQIGALALQGIKIDTPIVRGKGQRPPGGIFAKILSEMGVTSQNLTDGMKQVAAGGPVVQAGHDQLFGHGSVGHGLPASAGGGSAAQISPDAYLG